MRCSKENQNDPRVLKRRMGFMVAQLKSRRVGRGCSVGNGVRMWGRETEISKSSSRYRGLLYARLA